MTHRIVDDLVELIVGGELTPHQQVLDELESVLSLLTRTVQEELGEAWTIHCVLKKVRTLVEKVKNKHEVQILLYSKIPFIQ